MQNATTTPNTYAVIIIIIIILTFLLESGAHATSNPAFKNP